MKRDCRLTVHEGIILGLLDEVVEQLRLHGNRDDRVHIGGGGRGSMGGRFTLRSQRLSLSHTLTMNLKLRVGESLDNELTAMFTLNPSEIRPFFKGQGQLQLGYQDFDFSRPKRCSIV